MNITLINARNSDSIVTPYGILSIAAVLKKDGHTVQVFDPFFGNRAFIESVQSFKPDLIGISALTASYGQAKKIVELLRNKLPHTRICLGGIHATALPEKTLQDIPVDFVVLGEGEPVLSEICKNKENFSNFYRYNGIAYLNNGVFTANPRKPLIENLDDLPFPAWHLLPLEKYFIPPGYIRSCFFSRTLVIYSSRGCPHHCIFCASHKIFDHRLRRHSVAYFLNHIEYITKQYRLEGIYIMDDTFIINDAWLEDFCKEKKKRNCSIKWACQGRVGALTRQKASMLKEVGCLQIDFGVESGSPKVLQSIKKGITVSEIERAFEICHKTGIRPYASIMVGCPGETAQDVVLTKKLLEKIKPVYVSVGFCQPIPGSELYDMATANNWFDEKNTSFGTSWDVRLAHDPIMIINLTKGELKRLRADLQNTSFSRNYFSFIRPDRIPFIMSLLLTMLLHPKAFFGAAKKALYTKRLDDFIDFALTFYRSSQIRKRIHSHAEL